MKEFTYEFEELPLVTIDDVDVCLISGEATIEYHRSGEWEINHVAVDGYRGNKHVVVTAPTNIQAMVIERLFGSWRDKVQDAVSEQIEIDRELDEDSAADMKLSERKLGL